MIVIYRPLIIVWNRVRNVLDGAQPTVPTHAATASCTDDVLTHIPAFQMHHVSAPDTGERKPCTTVNGCDLEPLKSANL